MKSFRMARVLRFDVLTKQTFVGLMVIGVTIVATLGLLLSTNRIQDTARRNTGTITGLYSSLLTIKGQIALVVFSDDMAADVQLLKEMVLGFDEEIEVALELPLLATLPKVYPELGEYKEAISTDWVNTRRCYEGINSLIVDRSSSDGEDSFMSAIHEFLDATEVMLLPVDKLAAWMTEYSESQNNSIQALIYFLAGGVLAMAMLLMGLTKDVERKRKGEERMRVLAARTIEAQEHERKRIALELHDSIAQDLSATMISLGMVSDKESDGKISGVADSIKGVIESVRAISYDLRPPDFSEMGFSRAVSKYCDEFSQSSGIAMDFLATGMNGIELSREIENNLYRILQESLTNVKKHADAKKVVVRLTYSSPLVLLVIEDDGKSFDEAEVKARSLSEKRMGIQGMRERVSILKGTISISAAMGNGTRVAVRIPISREE